MRVLFFISVHGHGKGGHFHSLNHISQKVGEQNDVKIVSFGPGKSDIIESNPHFLKHITFNGFNLIHLRREINKLIQEFNPDIYHCFDAGGYNIIRLLISSKKYRLVLNKCGGPNPVRYPHVHNLILFSNENLEWFRNQREYQNSSIHLIPNRVKALSPDETFRPIAKRTDEFVFLRICRIGVAYRKSILDSCRLIEQLLSKDIHNVKLYVIGAVEDRDTLGKLQGDPFLVKDGRVTFLTEAAYTREAARMLYLADAVIGTGRGLMESASLSLPMLAINGEGNIPVLLNKGNFFDAFRTNFSERNVFPDYDHDENIKNICELVQNREYYAEMSQFSKEAFEHYFDLDRVAGAYPDAYNRTITGKRNLLTDAPLILRTCRYFSKSYLTARKKKK